MYTFKTNYEQMELPIRITDINGNIKAVFYCKDRALDYVYNDDKLFICERDLSDGQYQLYDIEDKYTQRLFQV